MKALELITTGLLLTGCQIDKPNPIDALKHFNEQFQRIPAQGKDPNLTPVKLPIKLSSDERETTKGTSEVHLGSVVQTNPSRMAYPYIDGAAAECRRLTMHEMELKRTNPEISITCGTKL